MQLMVFLGGVMMPSMSSTLVKLTLSHLPLSTIISASTFFSTACPQLAHLKLHHVALETGDDSGAPTATHLWQALAASPTLRRLKVTHLHRGHSGSSSSSALDAVSQLQSLSRGKAGIPLSGLSALVALSKLTLSHVVLPVGLGGPLPDLSCLSGLRRLRLRLEGTLSAQQLASLHVFTACLGLTSLRMNQYLFSDLGWADQLPFTRLVRLDSRALDATCAQLLALPALRELRCTSLTLPRAGAALALPSVRVVDVFYFSSPEDSSGGGDLPAQPLAQTLPHLAALVWGRPAEDDAPVPLAELLPATPAGRLLHLRRLSTPQAEPFVDRAGEHGPCAVAVEELVVGGVEHGSCPPLPALVAALRQAGRRLRRIELVDTEIDDPSLLALVSSWPAVEDVMLRGAEDVTDFGLLALARLPRLRSVTLMRCPEVTPSGVGALASRWSVERVEVCECDKVGAADMLQMHCLLGRPQLHVVHLLVERTAAPWWTLATTEGGP